MIVTESMVQMVVSMVLKQLPPGTGEKVAAFLNEKMTLIEETDARLRRIEDLLIAQKVELLKKEGLPDDDGSNSTG